MMIIDGWDDVGGDNETEKNDSTDDHSQTKVYWWSLMFEMMLEMVMKWKTMIQSIIIVEQKCDYAHLYLRWCLKW